jgi:heme/copper-type cytochrome/quinol oxidase subunit 1
VLVGGVVFPIFAGLYYWIPKITGRMMNEKLGQLNFWLMFAGFNISFFPMHIMGLLGMQRRIYTYPSGAGLTDLNFISTVGAFIMAIGVVVFLINFARSMLIGELAGDNPWHASTLEWATTSPPEPFNFRHIPIVQSADPLWDEPPDLGWDTRLEEPAGNHRELYATSMLEPEPQILMVMPEDTYLPLLVSLAMAIVFVGILLDKMVLIGLGGALGLFFMAWWLWPKEEMA